MRRGKNNCFFLQSVSDPFNYEVFSKEQLKIIKYAAKITTSPSVLCLDATGSIFSQQSHVRTRPLFYAGVIQTSPDGKIVPIFERGSLQHDAAGIGIFLANFKASVLRESKNQWPIFRQVVVDFSFALMNAVLLFWNNLSISEYLALCYSVLENNVNFPSDKISLKICCAHFLHIITNDINRAFNNKKVKGILKEILASAFKISSYEVFQKWFTNLVVLLCSNYNIKDVQESFTAQLYICSS